MEIKTFEDVKPYIAYVMHEGNPYNRDENVSDNAWLETCAAKYVKMVSDKMGINNDILLNDLKKNKIKLFLDDEKSRYRFAYVHYFNDNPRPVYAVRVDVDTYNGKLLSTNITKGYFRSKIENLWIYSYYDWDKCDQSFSPSTIHKWDGKGWKNVGNTTIIDTLQLCEDIDKYYCGGDTTSNFDIEKNKVGYTITCDEELYSNCKILKFFTTEEEAKSYMNEWKHKKLSKSQKCIEEENRIEKIYGNILSLAKKLSKDELVELKGLIDKIYAQKITDAKLNPLQLCYEYKDSATEIESFIIDGELCDYVESNYDIQRYELIEFKDIFDKIMSSYPQDATWKNIKKKDKVLIKELAEWFQKGYKGFKYDW